MTVYADDVEKAEGKINYWFKMSNTAKKKMEREWYGMQFMGGKAILETLGIRVLAKGQGWKLEVEE